ncbi:hypothetical protein [Streptomyces sp. NPDC056987]|uniref:hypothetical protein n=1 Tax=Streptomyces sp. NPDC056987 TaxID=3345988 RepID=UPI00363D0680
MGAVEAGDPEFAGGGVLAVVEAVPGDGLGEGWRQCVETLASSTVVAAVLDEVGHGDQLGVEQGGDVLPLLGGQGVESSAGVLEQGDRVVADGFAAVGLRGVYGFRAVCPGRGEGGEAGARDGEEGASSQVVHGCFQGLSQCGDGAGRSEGDDFSVAAGQPVRPVAGVDEFGRQFQGCGDVGLCVVCRDDSHDFPLADPVLVGS